MDCGSGRICRARKPRPRNPRRRRSPGVWCRDTAAAAAGGQSHRSCRPQTGFWKITGFSCLTKIVFLLSLRKIDNDNQALFSSKGTYMKATDWKSRLGMV